jgi:hypothetical protein
MFFQTIRMNKKKILIIVENLPVPFDTRVWKEACALYKNGYDVFVICPWGKGFESRYELLEGVHIYRHPMPEEGRGAVGYLIEYASALSWEILLSIRLYLKHRFDIIQGCNPPDNIFLVSLLFKIFGVKYIFDHHDVNPELYYAKFGRKDFLYKVQCWLEKMTFRCSDVVMSTNQTYRQIAIDRGKIKPENVLSSETVRILKNSGRLNPSSILNTVNTILLDMWEQWMSRKGWIFFWRWHGI